MRGYCPNCKEYRSDDGSDAWGFYWKDGMPICRRCGHLVDLFNYKDKQLTLSEYPRDRKPEKFPRIVHSFLRGLAERVKEKRKTERETDKRL